jgi:hypothetical protein
MYEFEFKYKPAVRWLLATGHPACQALRPYDTPEVRFLCCCLHVSPVTDRALDCIGTAYSVHCTRLRQPGDALLLSGYALRHVCVTKICRDSPSASC